MKYDPALRVQQLNLEPEVSAMEVGAAVAQKIINDSNVRRFSCIEERINNVEINLVKMIAHLERKMEERTLIIGYAESIDEIYDDYC